MEIVMKVKELFQEILAKLKALEDLVKQHAAPVQQATLKWMRGSTWATWSLVVVTIALVGVSAWIGNSHYRKLDEATFVQNRAYVHPEFPDTAVKKGIIEFKNARGMIVRRQPYEELVAIVTFVNYGKTPAYRFAMDSVSFESYGSKDTAYLRRDPKFFKGGPDSLGSVLAPGERSEEVIKQSTDNWSKTGRWYVYGKIWYVDFRGNTHSTSFGYTFEHLRSAFTRVKGASAAD